MTLKKANAGLRILHLEDSAVDAELIQAAVRDEGYLCEIVRADDRPSFMQALSHAPFDLILADYSLPSFDGVSALAIVRHRHPDIPFIFVSGTIGEDFAIECLKSGATDYVLKHRLGRLGPAIRRALVEFEERRQGKIAAEALRNQAQLLDLANDCIIVRDLEDRITYWNKGAQRLFGWSEVEVLRHNANQLLQSEFSKSLDQIRQAFLLNGHWEGEIFQKNREGRTLLMASRWTLQRAADGTPLATLEISNDITEDRRLEAQFLQAQKMESVGRLASGVAHDFNNLLTIIIGRSYLLLSRVGRDERMRKDLELIQKTADRAAALTRQLLAFSRKQAIVPRLLDVNTLIADMEGMLKILIGEDIQVSMCLAEDVGPVKADLGQMEQVIMNLAVNARDAMPGGGKLTLETANVDFDQAHGGQCVMIAVSDTGMGMDDATKSRIFEPFFTTKEAGTGLGLSTVYGIVKQSGGNVWAYSELQVGTTLKVYLPRVAETSAAVPLDIESQAILSGCETILLVEDEQAVREIIRETLSAQGYTVIEARHGPEALVIAEDFKGKIHVLLTDVVMPAMSGPQLAFALAKSHQETKVLFMSGYTDSVVMQEGVLQSGRNFLQKPFTLVDLGQSVRSLLDE